MKISELSGQSGVPVATIKYYLREGLLPKGEATAATQARYGEAHLRRLRLIRALLEVGSLPLATIRRVLDAVDDPSIGLHRLLGTAAYALGPAVEAPAGDPEWEKAEADVSSFIAGRGWHVHSAAPARRQLAQAIMTLRRLGVPVDAASLAPYADAADTLSRHEVDSIPADVTDRTGAVERLVVGGVLYEQVLLAMRRLAQEHASARRHPEH